MFVLYSLVVVDMSHSLVRLNKSTIFGYQNQHWFTVHIIHDWSVR